MYRYLTVPTANIVQYWPIINRPLVLSFSDLLLIIIRQNESFVCSFAFINSKTPQGDSDPDRHCDGTLKQLETQSLLLFTNLFITFSVGQT